jgi:hypothetical protein
MELPICHNIVTFPLEAISNVLPGVALQRQLFSNGIQSNDRIPRYESVVMRTERSMSQPGAARRKQYRAVRADDLNRLKKLERKNNLLKLKGARQEFSV